MPGMGIDPLAMSQGMFGGFGGQGIGMNNMNMGMGFNAGQGAFGGFNGQPAAWNTGQDKFSQNAYGGGAGMVGDFGANAGYGYNMPGHQGNFNQMHQHQYPNNDFHHGHHGHGFQNRGRGRGRGYPYAGRGRGGYNQVSQGNQANYEPFSHQIPQQVTRRGSPQYGPQEDRPAQEEKSETNAENQQDVKAEGSLNTSATDEQLKKELDPGDTGDDTEKATDAPSQEGELEGSVQPVMPEAKNSDPVETEVVVEKDTEKPAPIETFISDELQKSDTPKLESNVTIPSTAMPPPSPIIPTGPAALYTADQSLTSPRGRGYGRGFHRGTDHRGGLHGRGSGFLADSNLPRPQPTPSVVKPIIPPVEPKGLGVEGAPKAPKALREGQPNTGIKGFSIVGRASAAAQARPSGSAANKRQVHQPARTIKTHADQPTVRLVIAHARLLAIVHLIVGIIVIAH